jgi:catechol 2,3-dioxygenase-like lactoylglutathione lyase family enzyme
LAFPPPDAPLTNILVVADLARSVVFYSDVLGARLEREYGGTSAVFDFNGAWVLLVTGGPPTPDKPGVSFAPPVDPNQISHAITIRVQDCRAAYDELVARGAVFLTPPIDNGPETRCFFRDPDGHLFEISEFRTE